jgi:hypothetical protein
VFYEVCLPCGKDPISAVLLFVSNCVWRTMWHWLPNFSQIISSPSSASITKNCWNISQVLKFMREWMGLEQASQKHSLMIPGGRWCVQKYPERANPDLHSTMHGTCMYLHWSLNQPAECWSSTRRLTARKIGYACSKIELACSQTHTWKTSSRPLHVSRWERVCVWGGGINNGTSEEICKSSAYYPSHMSH